MKRLIRKSGIGQKYLDNFSGDTVTVFHGTSIDNYDSIMQNGIKQGGGEQFQNLKDGIWVSLDENMARGHAEKSVSGKEKLGSDNEWGVIFSFPMKKEDLSDEWSNNNKAFMSKVPITPQMLSAGSQYKFNVKTKEQEVL